MFMSVYLAFDACLTGY